MELARTGELVDLIRRGTSGIHRYLDKIEKSQAQKTANDPTSPGEKVHL